MATGSGKRILFLSSANLSTNPRTLKEIRLALSRGYEATFVGFKMGNWSDANDEKLLAELSGLHTVYFDATRSRFLLWLYDSLAERLARMVWPLFRSDMFVGALAHSKRTMRLLSFAAHTRIGEYDLVIGHTLPALYPTLRIAQKSGAKTGFDVEDYHPGEKIEPAISNEVERRKWLMKTLLPQMDYVTGASSMIKSEVDKLVGKANFNNHTVLNYFSGTEFIAPTVKDAEPKLKLVWFSQNISAGRGLEFLLSVWPSLEAKCTLTLIGKLDDGFYHTHLQPLNGIEVLHAMKQQELHAQLAKYDVGLALEDASEDYNRSICITNKILAYYQAGLYILATNTPAQKEFIAQRPAHGIITERMPVDISATLNKLYAQKDELRKHSAQRFTQASAGNWETEAHKIWTLWQNLS